MSEIHLFLNGRPVTAQSGQTIVEAALAVGIDIPTLCHHPFLSNHGACRICLVEVKGMRGFQTACTCPVIEGMEVQTETEKVIEGRKFALELLFAERNHYCMYCQVSGDCELQNLAYRYGLDHWRYPRSFKRMSLDASHPYIIMEPSRCVLCTRCVRACAEIASSHTLGLRERGWESMIMADVNLPLGISTCVGCGACLQVCPTGALIDSLSAYGGHEEDLTHTQTTCIQCSVGCTLDVVTRGNRLLRVEGVWGVGPSGGLLCVDGRFKPLYEKRCRVTKPQIRRNGKLTDAEWDDALELVAERLKSGSAFGLAACATTNEALEAFTRLFEHSGRLETAVPELGYGQPARLSDIQEADFIVVVGADPLKNQRVVGYFIKRAVDEGADLALIDSSENGLRDVAAMTSIYDGADAIVEQAVHATKVVIVYGTGLNPAVITALKPLADKALFLALEPARNGRGAQAVKLVPAEIQEANTLFFLLGEQEEDESVIGHFNAAFTIVQASFYSPLSERADVVLPAPIWAERSGHFTNLEGKVLPLKAVVPMPTGVRDDAEVFHVLAEMM